MRPREKVSKLETKAGLHFDGSSAESILGGAEIRVVDINLWVRKVELVEHVEKVGSNFELCPGAQYTHLREAE